MSAGKTSRVRLPLADWSDQDKPREKFLLKGAQALSGAELVAILLRTGSATENALELSKRILTQYNHSLNDLSNGTLEELRAVRGVGLVKAVTLMAAFELGRRMRAEVVEQGHVIRRSADVVELLQPQMATLKHEEFWVLYLNQGSKILKVGQVSKGGLTSTVVDVRLIMQEALLQEATGLILCHNHPSGSVRPSTLDQSLTAQIVEAAKLLNIRVVDHIVMSGNAYYSFAEHGEV